MNKKKIWWVILKDGKGWERRLKILPNAAPPIFRYPKKRKRLTVFHMEDGIGVTKQSDLETVTFERLAKQETDTAVFVYYAELE